MEVSLISLTRFPSLSRGHKRRAEKGSPCKQGCSQPGTPMRSTVEMRGTPLMVCRVDMFGEQAGHQYGRQALFDGRGTHPRPHIWFVSELPPELGEDLRGLRPPGKTQSCGLTAPPQSQAQAASSFHKQSRSFPMHICSASAFFPCKTSGFSIRPSPDALSRVGKSQLLL